MPDSDLTLARNHHALACGRPDETRSDLEVLRVVDIFVSYTGTDHEWVRWIAKALFLGNVGSL
jgi:hypothetical protein